MYTITRKEAIEQLQYCKGLIKQNGQVYLDERDIPLLNMAIEALSEPINCVKCKHYYETEDDIDVHGHCRMDTAHTNLISKEKAIEMLKALNMMLRNPDNDGTLKVKVANVLDIKRVMVMDNNIIYDSYYPDRPKGEWVDKGGYNECSECGEVAQKVELCDCVYERLTNFCPNCGADMRRQ